MYRELFADPEFITKYVNAIPRPSPSEFAVLVFMTQGIQWALLDQDRLSLIFDSLLSVGMRKEAIAPVEREMLAMFSHNEKAYLFIGGSIVAAIQGLSEEDIH